MLCPERFSLVPERQSFFFNSFHNMANALECMSIVLLDSVPCIVPLPSDFHCSPIVRRITSSLGMTPSSCSCNRILSEQTSRLSSHHKDGNTVQQQQSQIQLVQQQCQYRLLYYAAAAHGILAGRSIASGRSVAAAHSIRQGLIHPLPNPFTRHIPVQVRKATT
jgi:hypothetical protein